MQFDLNSIAQYGIFAVLFVWLLQNTMKESAKREEWLKNHLDQSQETNQKTVSTLELMNIEIKNEMSDVKDGVSELKQILVGGNGNEKE